MYKKPLQALILADDDSRAGTIEQGLLDAGGAVVQRIRITEGLGSRVAAIAPDVILIDLEKPAGPSFEHALEVVRSAHRPTVMFVERTDGETAKAAIDAGTSAYVVDGLRRERIRPVLDVAIARFEALARLTTELSGARHALEERKLVERAKSILMKQHGLAEHEAYALLRRSAMNRGVKIGDIARSVLTAADLVGERARV